MRARIVVLAAALLASAACNNEKWTLQGQLEGVFDDVSRLLGGSTLPGRYLAVIEDVHDRKSLEFKPGVEDALDKTRNAVRGLATCDYAGWRETSTVINFLSMMASDHPSALVRAECLDTLTKMAGWTLAAVPPAERRSTEAELLDAVRTLKDAAARRDDAAAQDPAYAFQVGSAVGTMAIFPFEAAEKPSDEAPARNVALAIAARESTARGALKSLLTDSLQRYAGDPVVREAMDRAYVAISASIIRMTLARSALSDPSDPTKVTALRDLAAVHPEGGADAVRRVLLFDAHAAVRREAARSLAAFPAEGAVPALIDALTDEMSDVRGAAARSLGDVTGQSFGDDRRAWVKWWHARPGGAGGEAGSASAPAAK